MLKRTYYLDDFLFVGTSHNLRKVVKVLLESDLSINFEKVYTNASVIINLLGDLH